MRAAGLGQCRDLGKTWAAGNRRAGEAVSLQLSTFSNTSSLIFSPPICLAFPREAYHDLGLRFDERLSTCEDWDFLLQAAALCGVADSPEITGVYRWWTHDESSRSIHSEKEWARNYQSIRSKLENTSIILPKGESSRIIELVEASYRLGSVESERDDVANRLRAVESERDDVANRLRAAEIERDEAVKIKSRLRRPMRRHVKRRIIMLRVQRALSFWSHRRRGRLRAKIGEYKGLLRPALTFQGPQASPEGFYERQRQCRSWVRRAASSITHTQRAVRRLNGY